MTDQVGADPADFYGVHIGDLQEAVDARIMSSTTAVDYLPGRIKPDGALSTAEIPLNEGCF